MLPEDAVENFEFVDDVVQGRIPREYIPSVEKGFRACMNKGPVAGFPARRPPRHPERRFVPRRRLERHGVPTDRARVLP